MTTQSKLADCPFCGAEPWVKASDATCTNNKCPIFNVPLPKSMWNTRHPSLTEAHNLIETMRVALQRISNCTQDGYCQSGVDHYEHAEEVADKALAAYEAWKSK